MKNHKKKFLYMTFVESDCVLISINWIGLLKTILVLKYLIRTKVGISYAVSCNCSKINTDLDDDLSLEKALTFCKLVMIIKLLFNKVFLEKCSDLLIKK